MRCYVDGERQYLGVSISESRTHVDLLGARARLRLARLADGLEAIAGPAAAPAACEHRQH
jgi:hypothetical protein